MRNLAGKTIDVHSHVGASIKSYACGEYPYAETVESLYYKQVANDVDVNVVFPLAPELFYDLPTLIRSGKLEEAREPFSTAPYQHENRMLMREVYEVLPELSERFLPFASVRHEVGDVRRDDFGAVLVLAELASLAVDRQQRVPEPPAETIDLPEAMLIETGVAGQGPFSAKPLGVVFGTEQLPLARNECLVAGCLKTVPDGSLIPVEHGEGRVVPRIGQTGHQLDAAGRAERLRVAVVEPHPAVGHPVDVRRAVLLAAVAAEALVADIVGHDEDDVRTIGSFPRVRV